MKKKTKSTKKSKKPVEKTVKIVVNVRQVAPKALLAGCKHVLRLVEDSTPRLLTFNTTEELNSWLFDFDYANYNKNPLNTGTWIDQIFLDVQGDIFDLDDLETERPDEYGA